MSTNPTTPSFNPGDIITNVNDWGTTTLLVLEISEEFLYIDNVEYYTLLILESPIKDNIGQKRQLATTLTDKLYKKYK